MGRKGCRSVPLNARSRAPRVARFLVHALVAVLFLAVLSSPASATDLKGVLTG